MTSFKFMVYCLEQLDLAIDQLRVNEPSFDRFSLMLTDNIMELALHQIAIENSTTFSRKGDKEKRLIRSALQRRFDKKVRLAKELRLFTKDECEAINYFHELRNISYHQGTFENNAIHAIAVIYIRLTASVFQGSFNSYSYCSSDKVPFRAVKYIGSNKEQKVIENAFFKLVLSLDNIRTDLANELIVSSTDIATRINEAIDFIHENAKVSWSKDDVVEVVQAQNILENMEEEEKDKIPTNVPGVDWIIKNQKLNWTYNKVKGLPRRIKNIKSSSEYVMLRRYKSLMEECEKLADTLDLYARGVEQMLDAEFEEYYTDFRMSRD